MARSSERDGILKVGPQYYRVFIELPPKADGRRRRESHTVRGSLEEAKAKRSQLLADRSRGEYVGRSDQRLGDYLVSWLAWKRPRVSGRTWQRYTSLPEGSVIPALGRLQLQDLTAQHLDDFYANCLLKEPGQRKNSKLSATTVHHRHVALKMALKRAVEQGILVKNPADFTSPPRPGRPQMRVLNEAEVTTLLGALQGTPAELVGYLGLMMGARVSASCSRCAGVTST